MLSCCHHEMSIYLNAMNYFGQTLVLLLYPCVGNNIGGAGPRTASRAFSFQILRPHSSEASGATPARRYPVSQKCHEIVPFNIPGPYNFNVQHADYFGDKSNFLLNLLFHLFRKRFVRFVLRMTLINIL